MDITLARAARSLQADLATAPPMDPPACPRCGGERGGRLSLGTLATLVGKHVKLERGLLHTLLDLTLRPRGMLRGYLAGDRRSEYVNPVSFLLLAAGTSLLVGRLYLDGYRAWMGTQVATSTAAWQSTADAGPERAEAFVRHYVQALYEVMQSTTFTGLALVIPFGLALRLAFRKAGVNLAESLALALYVTGHAIFLHTALVAPFLVAGEWDLAQNVGLVLYLVAPLWLGLGYFGASAGHLLRFSLAMLAAYLVGTAIILAAVAVIVAVRLQAG